MVATLPDKPSDLLELALADLERGEKDPQVEIDMGEWLWNRSDGKCVACLAGCVMRYSLSLTQNEYLSPSDTRNRWELLALNEFREGCIWNGLEEFYHRAFNSPATELPEYIDVASYDTKPDEFKADMRNPISMLREKNL